MYDTDKLIELADYCENFMKILDRVTITEELPENFEQKLAELSCVGPIVCALFSPDPNRIVQMSEEKVRRFFKNV